MLQARQTKKLTEKVENKMTTQTTKTTQGTMELGAEVLVPKITIKQATAIASSPEALVKLDLEQIEGLIEVLKTSEDKKVARKLDMVKGELERRKKEVKGTEAEKEIKAVENSVKQVAKKIVPRGSATAKPKEIETKPAGKAIVKPKATTPAKETPAKKAFEFPATIGDLTLMELADAKAVSKAVIENPYKVRLYMLEPGMKELTAFLVTYSNDEVMVLLDLSAEINSVVPIDMTTYKVGKVKFDGKLLPVGFYLAK